MVHLERQSESVRFVRVERHVPCRARFRHVVAPGQPSVVEAHPTLEY